MMLHRTINDIIQTLWKEIPFFFLFGLLYCYWLLLANNIWWKAKNLYEMHSCSNWWWFVWPKIFLQNYQFINYLSIMSCLVNMKKSSVIVVWSRLLSAWLNWNFVYCAMPFPISESYQKTRYTEGIWWITPANIRLGEDVLKTSSV